ncbi:hypothetical protein CL634_00015 [bacterium]|nr:hypothetical protein [bacterium]|tara:strand:- start:745 stop:1146 length:402 start_codon:yes stop_codon:yes gene_type:complete
MEESYEELVRQHENFKAAKDKQFKTVSKERLLKLAKKKVQTTMIGSLSTVEKFFGFLWGHENDGTPTPEEQHMKELYEEVRSEILDRGNTQARNLEAEFAYYDIEWLRYRMEIPIKSLEDQDTNTQGDEDGTD